NPITEQMIVPFAIFAADDTGKFTIDRSRHYLIDEFDRLYHGRLHREPAWKDWVAGVELLSPKAAGAFAGTVNLQDYETQIDSLADTTDRLRQPPQRYPPAINLVKSLLLPPFADHDGREKSLRTSSGIRRS